MNISVIFASSSGVLFYAISALPASQNLRICAAKQVVGIDLGTTNSAVAAMEGGKPTIVTNAEGTLLPC